MKKILSIAVLLIICFSVQAQQRDAKLSAPMEKAVDACKNIANAMASMNAEQLKAANKVLKAADIVNFGNLRLVQGKDMSVDGHFIFDEEFVDSLIVNRKVREFSSRYAKKRGSNRGSTGVNGRIKMTTKALKAGQSATWKTSNHKTAEYAIVAEPGGLFTMTIRNETGKIVYTETVNNKRGAEVRKVRIPLPDYHTKIFLDIKNNSKTDASFAILSN